MIRPLNAFEKAEFLLDVGSKGNLNFSVISTFKGSLDDKIVRLGIEQLQKMHPLLRATLSDSRTLTHFVETAKPVPVITYAYEGPEQWKQIVKQDLAGRFDIENDPLWRVSLLQGDREGQLLVTFHHAIADGVCAMQMMNHLYELFSQLSKNEQPPKIAYDASLPDLKTLYPLSQETPPEDPPIPDRIDRNYHTAFVKEVINEKISQNVLEWTKAQGIKVHATLFAALLQAVRRVINPPSQDLTALTAVNYRPFFNPLVSKDTLTLLRTCIADTFPVEGNEDFATLAKAFNRSVHSQLEAGKHVLNLKALEQRLARNPTPEELWKRSKFPENATIVTNLGTLDFPGEYGNNLSVDELFFVANVEPFIEASTNVILGAVTFKGKIFLTLWFLEELVEDKLAQAVLSEMRQILATLQPALASV